MEPNDSSALVLGPAGRASARVPGAPRMSAASAAPLREITAVDEQGVARMLQVPIERPLTLVVDGREIVTLMTLGAAPEWLALGYLRNQRLIEDVTDLRSVEVDWTLGVARVISQQWRSRRPRPIAPRSAAALVRHSATSWHRFEGLAPVERPDHRRSRRRFSPFWTACAATMRFTGPRDPCTAARCSKAMSSWSRSRM